LDRVAGERGKREREFAAFSKRERKKESISNGVNFGLGVV
jgi:hypothetical protein